MTFNKIQEKLISEIIISDMKDSSYDKLFSGKNSNCKVEWS